MALQGREPYAFDRGFESALVYLLCSNPRVFGKIGRDVDPELLSSDAATAAVEAAQAIAFDVGRGPDDTMLVIQRMRRWQQQGRATQELINDVVDLLDEAEDLGLPEAETLVSEVVPIISRRAEIEAVRDLINAHGKRQDLEDIITRLAKSQRMGTTDESYGVRFGIEGFREIERMRQLTRLPTGIDDLDSALLGGLPLAALGVIIGEPGSGKSMALSHIAANAIYNGLNVLYATLELPETEVLARVVANLTGIPTTTLTGGDVTAAEQAVLALEKQRGLGGLLVKEFTAHAATVDDLKLWKKNVEEVEGQPVHVFITDYGDKVAAPKDQSEYHAGRIVFEGLRIWAVEDRIWQWTAAQSKRRSDRKPKRLDLHDVADSMHKVRVADIVVTMTPKGEQAEEILWYVAKHRTGPSRMDVGPLPTEFECGRIAPVIREDDFNDDLPF